MGLICMSSQRASAQTTNGSIAGSVVDSGGASIPNARITLVGNATGSKQSTASTSGGYYRFPSVPSGTYSLTYTAAGFGSVQKSDVVVQLNSVTAVDVSLEVGAVSTAVQVSADAVQVQTESSDVGTVVTPKQVVDLPLSVGSGYMRNAGRLRISDTRYVRHRDRRRLHLEHEDWRGTAIWLRCEPGRREHPNG